MIQKNNFSPGCVDQGVTPHCDFSLVIVVLVILLIYKNEYDSEE